MLHDFLETHRVELIQRCRDKVALRAAPRPTPAEMEFGIPLFLTQLIETLRIEVVEGEPRRIGATPRASASDRDMHSKLATSATLHGNELLQQGFTVDQVVHDYGDLCQAVTELAVERQAPVSADEFHTLNRCLDNAIADAVTEYGLQRDRLAAIDCNRAMSERLGFLAHEIRNLLNTATLAFAVMKNGTVGMSGATSAVLDRSLAGLAVLTERALAEVRLATSIGPKMEDIVLAGFIAEAQVGAGLSAAERGCQLSVVPVEQDVVIHADRQLLHSAVFNLLQNAFKFTHQGSHVTLRTRVAGARVLLEVEDECGGLDHHLAESMFVSFSQHDADRSGLGLGLSIARRAVEASGGKLGVRNLPHTGCIFTIDLPCRLQMAA